MLHEDCEAMVQQTLRSTDEAFSVYAELLNRLLRIIELLRQEIDTLKTLYGNGGGVC